MRVASTTQGVSIELGTPDLGDVLEPPAHGEIRPLAELRTWGIVWLLNRVVFHPSGYAFCFAVDDGGEVVGWTLLGDGGERLGAVHIDERELLIRTMALLEPRPIGGVTPSDQVC